METRHIGIAMNGVTGRMGTNQHLIRSVLAIIEQGGVRVSPELTIMPVPVLLGRNENKLKTLAKGPCKQVLGSAPEYTTDIDATLTRDDIEVFFDASGTLQRKDFVEQAARQGKHVYCEKPVAVDSANAYALADNVEAQGVKNGVVQDKLWLPGIRKLKSLIDTGFFGEILSVRGEFGYWVFSGHNPEQPAQRPSWNYRSEDGGGIIIDMFCHWQYVIDNLFGPIDRVVAWANTDLPERIKEDGKPYKCTADDSAYAMFLLESGVMCQFNSSWATRVRRDDLLTIQVDGTHGSAAAGLRECRVQPAAATPKPVWNPDLPQPIDFYDGWQLMPNATDYDNAFKIQWEMFLRHVVLDEPFPWTIRKGAEGVRLAEIGIESWKEGRWIGVEAPKPVAS